MQSLIRTALLSVALFSTGAYATEFNVGVGVGPQYTGLGASTKYFSSHRSAVAVSVGCVFIGSYGDNCGLGVSYERTDIITRANNRHALGAYVGLISSENVMVMRTNQTRYYERRDVYGASLFYSYYFNQFTRRGFHLGAHTSIRDYRYGTRQSAGLNMGYRF